MPYFGQCASHRVLNRQSSVCLIALFLGRFTPGDILDHPFVIEYFATYFIAHNTRTFRNPDDTSTPTINLRLKFEHLPFLPDELDELIAAARLNIELAGDVR